MTLRKAAVGEVISYPATYDIDFINDEGDIDETQFDVNNLKELEECWRDFCKDNGFKQNSITSITRLM